VKWRISPHHQTKKAVVQVKDSRFFILESCYLMPIELAKFIANSSANLVILETCEIPPDNQDDCGYFKMYGMGLSEKRELIF